MSGLLMGILSRVLFFEGGAAGSWTAAYAWSRWGWSGVCSVGAGSLIIGLVRYLLPSRGARRG